MMSSRSLVAPLVGAWIEIALYWIFDVVVSVAPLVGAWIEILLTRELLYTGIVAPLVGAWIEITTLARRK